MILLCKVAGINNDGGVVKNQYWQRIIYE